MSVEILVALILRLCSPYSVAPMEGAHAMCVDALNNCAVGRGGLILKQDAFKEQCVDRLDVLIERERKRNDDN